MDCDRGDHHPEAVLVTRYSSPESLDGRHLDRHFDAHMAQREQSQSRPLLTDTPLLQPFPTRTRECESPRWPEVKTEQDTHLTQRVTGLGCQFVAGQDHESMRA